MIVKELKEFLETIPDDAIVCMVNDGCYISEVKIFKYEQRKEENKSNIKRVILDR